jgi:hypothetical protein
MGFNSVVKWLLSSPVHGLMSRNTMVIEYRGRKSGKLHPVPVNYQRRDGELLTTSLKSRVWWRSLRGGAPVRILLRGRWHEARAEVIEDEGGVARGISDYLELAPGWAKYFGVGPDAGGKPLPEDVARSARDKVIIRTTLIGLSDRGPGTPGS